MNTDRITPDAPRAHSLHTDDLARITACTACGLQMFTLPGLNELTRLFEAEHAVILEAEKMTRLAAYHEWKAAAGHPNNAHYYAALAASERARAAALTA